MACVLEREEVGQYSHRSSESLGLYLGVLMERRHRFEQNGDHFSGEVMFTERQYGKLVITLSGGQGRACLAMQVAEHLLMH